MAKLKREKKLIDIWVRIRCTGGRSFRSRRERWWFIAVANCNSTRGLHLDYKILMTNGPPSDRWRYHFSADEFSVLQTDIAFFVCSCALVVVTIVFGFALRQRQLLHTTYRMFIAVQCLDTGALLFAVVANVRYMADGVGAPGARTLADVLAAAATLVFQLLLILLAKGFTVTRGRLRQASAVKIAVFMTVYGVAYACVFVTEAALFDPGLVLYTYESLAGYVLVAIRIVGWLWFVYATIFTVKHYPEKWRFYLLFFAVYSAWFLAAPVVVVVANFRIAKWVRAKVVNGIERAIGFAGRAFFLALTSPVAVNKVRHGKNQSKTCEERESILKRENGQFINLTAQYHYSGCTNVVQGDKSDVYFTSRQRASN
ncbi:PREDICTED: transmembrane protein 145-like [Priapulus caudatus]|uniref:Transmembrane protein 145-like n=1 Tax=Priapulus caudatus TaxID=37621 RepID=A0ABM1E5P4_PRICU|nr:PREDICTED: transmembrane protein 145-like [Priapulus caudatus]